MLRPTGRASERELFTLACENEEENPRFKSVASILLALANRMRRFMKAFFHRPAAPVPKPATTLLAAQW